MTPTPMPVPDWFVPARAADAAYSPNVAQLADAAVSWRAAHAIAPAGRDERKIELLLIDVQRDFCFPNGSLYVAGRTGTGAIDDSRRIAELVYRNLSAITGITVTLDTHYPFQIFFAAFWLDRDGGQIAPHRTITAEQIARGDVRPNPALATWLCGGDIAWLDRQVLHYARELERAGKYQLYVWPSHCVLGSDGHALAGVVHEARMFHALCRFAQPRVEPKGDHPLTENYSVLRPEVLTQFDGAPLAARNDALLDRLLAADALVIAGQAASHCVKSTIDDLLDAIVLRDRALARKVYVVTDCMSAVTVPDGKGGFVADFTPQADAALARYAEAGMHLVTSREPIAAWLR